MGQVSISEETILDVTRALSRIEANQENLKAELLGNGQPGRIQRIEAKADEHEEDIESLRKTKWIMIGGLVVLGHAVENIGKYLLAKMGVIS